MSKVVRWWITHWWWGWSRWRRMCHCQVLEAIHPYKVQTSCFNFCVSKKNLGLSLFYSPANLSWDQVEIVRWIGTRGEVEKSKDCSNLTSLFFKSRQFEKVPYITGQLQQERQFLGWKLWLLPLRKRFSELLVSWANWRRTYSLEKFSSPEITGVKRKSDSLVVGNFAGANFNQF